MTFYITCSRTINYDFEIEADSEEDAIEKVYNMDSDELEWHAQWGDLDDITAENLDDEDNTDDEV